MSYRDLRNFSEAMCALGFPRQISLESFRSPNWSLVEECVRWLAARAEPDGAALPGGGASQAQRVDFVTAAVALFHSRANLKLNGKRLYGADGLAARELLKAAAFLRTALAPPAALSDAAPPNYDVGAKLGDIKQARALATEITAQGAFLYELLAKEPEHKVGVYNNKCWAAMAEYAEAKMAAKEVTERAREATAESNIRRRTGRRRVAPAYQGELTALEGEIEALWGQYVLRYRCVEALKHQLSVLDAAQAEAAEEQQAAIMQLIHKYEAEDVLGKLSDSEEMDSSDEEKDLSEARQPRPATRPKTRLRIKTAGVAAAEARKTFGSMAARDSLDEIRDEDDSQTDDEVDFSDAQLYGIMIVMSSTELLPYRFR
ncbi:hypothetical protein ACJJTC_002894 [Scirpophaga incertulas]